MKLIPINQDKAIKFEEKLRNIPYLSNPEQFIFLINKGLLNIKANEILKLLEEIQSTYINIRLINNKLILRSEQEVATERCQYLFKQLNVVSALKRFANNLKNEDFEDNTKIVFEKSVHKGKPLVELKNNNIAKPTIHWSSEKVVDGVEEIAKNIYLTSIVLTYDNDPNKCYFLLGDLLNLDDSFILPLQDYILTTLGQVKNANK